MAYVALFFALAGTAAALPGKNSVDSGDIENGQIRSRDIQDQGILGKDVGNEAIGGLQVDDGSLGGADVENGALTGADLSDESVTGADVTDEALSGADIGGLDGSDVSNGGLTGADVSDESLTGADLTNGGLTGADVGDESLTGADISEGSLNGVQAAPAFSSTGATAGLPASTLCDGLDGLGPSVNVNVSANRMIAVYAEAEFSAAAAGQDARVSVAEGSSCTAPILASSSTTPTLKRTDPGTQDGTANLGGWVVARVSSAGPQTIGLRYDNSSGLGPATFGDRFLAVVPY